MNFLEMAEADRPDLPTRDRGGDAIEVQCPACQQWRPGFMLEPVDGGGWACDAERMTARRESDAAIAAETPPPNRVSFAVAMQLHTPAEIERILTSAEPMVSRLIIAGQLLGVVIGSVQHQQGVALFAGLGLLDDALTRPPQIIAGELPQ